MIAMVLHNPADADQAPLTRSDLPTPEPRDGQVLVRVHACGVCRTDLHQVEGDLPMRAQPVVPGHQVVGTVARLGAGVSPFRVGERVGVAWLHHTCGRCGYCTTSRENLCPAAAFTGWSVNGGYAEFVAAPADFVYRLPADVEDVQAAPLLCAGIIGYRALRLCEIRPGGRLGLFGFGGSAHIAIQVARHWGCEVLVFTRGAGRQALAQRLGAAWTGHPGDTPPHPLDAAVIFSPAGEHVPLALERCAPGATVAVAGIWLSNVPPLSYLTHLYQERCLRSVTNATRQDGVELLRLAGEIPIRTTVRTYPLTDANGALADLRHGRIEGAGVLTVE